MSAFDFKSICGVLNVHKPEGLTSRQAVTEVEWHLRRLAREAGQKLRRGTVKVGHAGTLDPLATGVLVVCLGKATRLVPYIQDQPKTYKAEFTLGMRSDSDDTCGTIEEIPNAPRPSREEIVQALSHFEGTIEQVPPQFSAVHVEGVRAYALARRGQEVELESRPVNIYQIELLDYAWPELSVQVVCGSGTYIRSLARDLGEQLGCGALMHGLERTAIGSFLLEEAVEIPRIKETNWLESVQPARVAVTNLPRYTCTLEEQDWLINGRVIQTSLPCPETTAEQEIAVYNVANELVCLAREKEKTGEQIYLQPRLVFLKGE
ncbi:MAG: tRNA pseudouridine(55) synthase TruB [Planctomycetaceae bacterium]|nr:tRNA pseudouridine(55) synthase TruB [Planctomycetaceae bacterium]